MNRNIIFIVLSLLVLYFTTAKFEYLFLFIPALLLFSYCLSKWFLKIRNADKSQKNKKSKNLQFFFFIGLFSNFIVFRTYEDTIGGFNLYWTFSLLSPFVTLAATMILNEFYILDENYKYQNLLGICICFLLFVPNLGIFINKYISFEPQKKESTIISDKILSKSAKGNKSYMLYIKTKYDDNERLDVDKEIFDAVEKGKPVVLTLQKGIFGYDYINKIEVNNSLK